jgi:hypothetical protein
MSYNSPSDQKVTWYNQFMVKHSLESFRIFPYIAWLLIGSFSYFVYTLTISLNEERVHLEEQIASLEERSKQDPATITDFSR